MGPTGPRGNTGASESIVVRSTTTGAPGTQAQVNDTQEDGVHLLDFVIPRGADGACGTTGATGATGPAGATGVAGERGPMGPAGQAATIRIGNVCTGEPGSLAEVNNSGTQIDAILNFVIPRGDTGTGGAPQVLAAVESAAQTSRAGCALIFRDTPLLSGSAITRPAGAADVQIAQPGVYQVAFDGTVSVSAGMSIPAAVLVRLYLDGVPVTGAAARHTFASTGEMATVSFHVPFAISGTPATVQVVVDETGFIFEDITMTIIRLGDATAVRTAT